ncbi:MAG: VOC family protein [Rhodobacteraceae bacterium]|nr:VOC family protein [Paracoccaceae bacterium]
MTAPVRLALDHLAVTAATLEEGADHIARALGVAPGPGGRHPAMGTWNRLLALGEVYLEAIAVDPAAPPPGRPRWFGLDAPPGRPRLAAWVLRAPSLAPALALLPEAGAPVALSRGDLAWAMAVPAAGGLPFDGLFPALIAWEGAAHPVQRLPDRGLRLLRLELCHPEAAALAARLAPLLAAPRLAFLPGPPALRALIETGAGPRWLD